MSNYRFTLEPATKLRNTQDIFIEEEIKKLEPIKKEVDDIINEVRNKIMILLKDKIHEFQSKLTKFNQTERRFVKITVTDINMILKKNNYHIYQSLLKVYNISKNDDIIKHIFSPIQKDLTTNGYIVVAIPDEKYPENFSSFNAFRGDSFEKTYCLNSYEISW